MRLTRYSSSEKKKKRTSALHSSFVYLSPRHKRCGKTQLERYQRFSRKRKRMKKNKTPASLRLLLVFTLAVEWNKTSAAALNCLRVPFWLWVKPRFSCLLLSLSVQLSCKWGLCFQTEWGNRFSSKNKGSPLPDGKCFRFNSYLYNLEDWLFYPWKTTALFINPSAKGQTTCYFISHSPTFEKEDPQQSRWFIYLYAGLFIIIFICLFFQNEIMNDLLNQFSSLGHFHQKL